MQRSVRGVVRVAMRLTIMGGLLAVLASCGGIGSGDSGLFGRRDGTPSVSKEEKRAAALTQRQAAGIEVRRNGKTKFVKADQKRRSFFGLFNRNDDPNITVEVNKYLWQASLEVLNFLPIQSVDPFSGVIVTGFGTPPGGGRAYRATIYVQDPALDARSLKVALVSKSGPADAATVRAVEDAILTRARQLRIRDTKL